MMPQHLETIQVIVAAFVEEDDELARGLTELHLGFFKPRQAMAIRSRRSFLPPIVIWPWPIMKRRRSRCELFPPRT